MNVHRLIVRSPQGDLTQGTAWVVAPGMVCSAFHVVGYCSDGRWTHENVEGVTYWLEDGAVSHALTPTVFDAEADLALLACDGSARDALPLAELSRKNVPFETRGYPGFHGAQEFTLSGTVVDLRPGEGARAMQLGLDQGADVGWGGISGAPVVDQLRVVAVITNVTAGTATAWAAPVEAIRRLVELADLATQAAQATDRAIPAGKPGAGNLGVDRRRLEALLSSLARERPDDPVVAALRETLARNQPKQAVPSLSVADAVRLRDDYDVISVREGVSAIRPVASREFAEILGGSASFGGRHQELAKLDRHALQTPSGYFFLTGISGFGKTSLLARWIDLLRRRGDSVCFHFFTPRVPDSLEAKHAFLRLSEQLLAAHALGGDLPRDDEARLRALYVDLLALPAPGGRPLIVVLDGLDEARESLRPSPAMFPRRLGEGVHVVFSARHVAGRDWLADLDLKLDDEARCELGRLSQADITEILERAGLPSDADFAAKLTQKTSGDPFYVADVVRALAKADDVAKVLDKLPDTHSDYLNAWWNEAIKRVARPGFVDLMGTLAALRAPLGARELTSISADDELDNATIGVLLEEAARYVDADRERRYWLRHDRIRQFVREILGNDMRKYDERVAKFALRWNDATATEEARGYGRRHVIAHLLAENQFASALDVVGADFISARWREDGSYSALLGDLDALFAWAQEHPEDRSAMCHALSLAVLRESARDLMRSLPAPLCRAWVRLQGKARPLEMLASLPSHRGEARDQLLAIAGEMLDLAAAGAAGQADRATAGELLARTVGLLPMVRTGAWALDALSEICRLLAAHLDAGSAEALLTQGIAYASQLDEQRRDLKAVSLAHLAAAALPRDRAVASHLIEELNALAGDLPVPERALALATAFPAYRELSADRIDVLAEATVDELVRNPSQSAFSASPLQLLFSAWAPDGRAAAVARGTAELDHFSLAVLCKLGLTDIAWQRVETELQSGEPAVALLLEGHDAFPAQRAPLVEAMAALSPEAPATPELAQAFACVSRWADMRTVLTNLDDKSVGDTLPACLKLVLAQGESAEREQVVEFIVEQLQRIPIDDAPEPAGEVAHALSRIGHAKAPDALGLAFRLALSKVPEGDADDTRQVVAVALACEGKLDQALDVALACDWWHRRIATLAAVLHALAADAADRVLVAERIGDLLGTPDGTFSLDAIRTACQAALALGPAHSAAALHLVEKAEASYQATNTSLFQGEVEIGLELHRTLARLDSERAGAQGNDLLIRLRKHVYADDGPNRRVLYQAIFSLCASLIEGGAAEKALIINQELGMARDRTEAGEDRIAILAAAGAAIAKADPARAAEWLREGMDSLRELKGASVDSSIRYFRRLIRDLTGAGREEGRWVTALGSLLAAMVGAATRFTQESLSELLVQAWAHTLELAEDAGALQSAASTYLKHLCALPAEREETLKTVLGRVVADLEQRRGELDVDQLLTAAAFDLGSRGLVDLARETVQSVADPERRDEAAGDIESFSYFYRLGDRTPTEQALFDVLDNKDLATMVVQQTREGQADGTLMAALAAISDARVRMILFNVAPALAAVVMHRWGAVAGKDIVDAIAEFDRRLIAAASQAVRQTV